MAGYVQNLASFTNGTSANSKTITLSVSPTPGNMITVAVNTNGTQTLSAGGVTDNVGNTYNIRAAGGTNADDPHYADALVAGTITTVTVKISAVSAQWCVSIDEWSGVTPAGYVAGGFAQAHGTASPTSVTPALAGTLVIGCEGHHTGATPASTWTATGSFTKDAQTNKPSGQFDSIVIAHDASGTGPHAFSGTLNNTPVGWTADVFVYSSSIAVTAPAASLPFAGGAASAAERASAPAASVPLSGGASSAREAASAPRAVVSFVGQQPIVPQLPRGDRGPWYRPVIETVEEWAEWWRQP